MSEKPKEKHAAWHEYIYQIISASLIVVILNFLILFVVPQFEVIFASFENLELPLITKILINPLCRVFFAIGSFALLVMGVFLIRKIKRPRLVGYAMFGIVVILTVSVVLALFMPIMTLQSQLHGSP